MSQKQIVITGAKGQLGLTLQSLWEDSELQHDFELCCTDIEEMDITSCQSIRDYLGKRQVEAIINTAAYTAVDKAEAEPELAYSINSNGAENIANFAHEHGCKLIHISTDFVFSGSKDSPYFPDDETGPLSVYGKSKLAGEQAILSKCPDRSTILRTSWLYSQFQSNFVKTMLRLLQEREELNVVDDQIGAPTSTNSLIELIFKVLAANDSSGIYHWSDSGNISWYDFALEIQKQGLVAGIINSEIPINPILTEKYPTPAQRPSYSVLDTEGTQERFSIAPKPWKESLQQVIQKLAA